MAWTKEDRQHTVDSLALKQQPSLLTLSEEVVDDANKNLLHSSDIGEGSAFEILSIRVEYTATATVGSRVLALRMFDGGADIIRELKAAQAVAATETIAFEWAVGYSPPLMVEASPNALAMEPLPQGLFLLPGQTLRIFDRANIDQAADDMIVHITGLVHP